MLKTIKIYKSLDSSKEFEIEYQSNLSIYNRFKNAMDLIKKVYSRQISENKKSKRIKIISAR